MLTKLGLFFSLLISSLYISAQDYFIREKFELSSLLEETSGLIYFNNRLITHNDGGNEPKLYEIDTITSNINRIVTVINATNVDWEDLAQDDTYIYIGDIGNNSGDRTNLRVYRILKTDYLSSTSVVADVINFSYADQTDFTPHPHNTNWDAESLLVWENQLFLFSKNWIDHQVNLYVFPKTPGTHIASIQSTYNLQALATAATITPDNRIYLLAYTTTMTPLFVVLSSIDLSTDFDLFNNSNLLKYTNILISGNQTEAICSVSKTATQEHLFISCEKEGSYPQKLRTLDFNLSVFGLGLVDLENEITCFPNPFTDCIYLNQKAKKIEIYNNQGVIILKKEDCNLIETNQLKTGVYFIKIEKDNRLFIKKMIKS
jgi:hypothetical protein